jgi:GntR family transcriptional regulator
LKDAGLVAPAVDRKAYIEIFKRGEFVMSLHAVATQLPGFAGPLYVQVAGILRDKICASEWTARAPLPNEVTLARDIGVSIGTVRKALEMLENEHLIQRRQGRGTFVVETSHETEMERFSNLVNGSRKLRADAVVWTASQGVATDEEAQVLNIRQTTRVCRLESLWSAGDMTNVYERITVDDARFQNLQKYIHEGGQFLFPVYRRHYQEPVKKVTEQLTAVNADDAIATKLSIPKGHAVLRAGRIAYAMSGGPIEWSRRYMHLARSAYSVTMT